MFAGVKENALKRVIYIEGYLAGIRNMSDEDKDRTIHMRFVGSLKRWKACFWNANLSRAVESIKTRRTEYIVDELKDIYILANK